MRDGGDKGVARTDSVFDPNAESGMTGDSTATDEQTARLEILVRLKLDLAYCGNFPCEPSQKGLFPDCLQPHQKTFLASANSAFTGVMPVPLCEPSQ